MSREHNILKPGFPSMEEQSLSVGMNAAYRQAVASHKAAEAVRVEAVKASGSVPDMCGPEIPAAPARGFFSTFRPMTLLPGSNGTAVPSGFQGRGEAMPRRALKIEDVFTSMEEGARRRHGDGAGPFVPPFTPGQVATGRLYAHLVERHETGGVRCASLEAGRSGTGANEFIDSYIAEGMRLARLQARIGGGVAMEVRRIRPSRRGARAKGVIRDRALVDMVCIGQRTLSQVLAAHGWSAKGQHRDALRKALAAALDRMQGYDLSDHAR